MCILLYNVHNIHCSYKILSDIYSAHKIVVYEEWNKINIYNTININNYHIIFTVENKSENWRISSHNLCCSCSPCHISHPPHSNGNVMKQNCNHALGQWNNSKKLTTVMTVLFSHTSYAIHKNHYHTNEQPNQHYSIQLSHSFNKDNIPLPCTKTLMKTSYTKFPLFCLHHKYTDLRSYFNPTHNAQHSILTWLVTVSPCTLKRLFLPSISYKTHPLSQAVAAWGATVLVSKRPFKFHRGFCRHYSPEGRGHRKSRIGRFLDKTNLQTSFCGDGRVEGT